MNALDAALEHLRTAQGVADRIQDQKSSVQIARWIVLTEQARAQLISKKLFSNKNSFKNQQQVVQEIRNYRR